MKSLILIGLCFLVASCNNGDTYHRGYVISKSHEAFADTEPVTEQLSE